MATTTPADRLIAVFRRTPVADMGAIERAVPGRSRRSLCRDLVSLDYLTSYSHAGRYYTLRATAPFDSDGLWQHQGIGFSRHGTLKLSVVHLVKTASAGRTHEELEQRLCVRVHNTLLDLVKQRRLGRETVGRSYVYVNVDSTTAAAQLAERGHLLASAEATALPAMLVIEVLVEVIQVARVRGSPATIAKRLSARGIAATTEQIERVLHEHGIGKKGLRSRSRRSPS